MTILKSFISVSLAATMASAAFAENIAITGGTAFTEGGKGKVENATVLIKDGKFEGVSAGGAVPSGYRTVDASGKWVTVGFMASGTTLGLSEVSLSGGLNDSRPSAKNSIGMEVSNAFNPATVIIPITRIEGVTRAVTGFSGGKDMWRGQGSVIALFGDDMIVRHNAFVYVDMDEGAARSNGGSRAALWDSVITKLEGARPKQEDADKKDADKKPKKPKYDSGKTALDRVMKREVPLMISVERAADIRRVVGLKDRFDIDIIIVGGAEAWMAADALAAANIPVVLDPTRNLPGSFDSLAATGAGAARLAQAGVTVAFLPPGNHNSRLVVQNAGNAVAMGMSWDAAVDALTVNPAKIFGVADSYGTMSAGMDADVVVWDGDPLEVMTSPDAVFIRGEEVPLVSRQTKLRDRYKDIPRAPGMKR